MKILVAICSYGTAQDQYLAKLLASYRAMPFDVHLVVLSNLAKNLGPDVEVRVGLPTKDPWSLPFGHKQLFADRLNEYDLFLYSEDDMLISEKNVRAFVEACEVLNDDEVPGFLRTEADAEGREYFCDAFDTWHWNPYSVVERGGKVFASFSNEHSAAYILNRAQLRKCIESGGFLIPPHEDRHDLLCAAATDPYTRCGLKRLIGVSDFEQFLVPHLSNKYVGKCSLPGEEFRRQVKALLEIHAGSRPVAQLFETETLLPGIRWSKSYYEAARPDEVNLVAEGAKSVLCVGSGSGLLEEELKKRGVRVVALPIDSVIAACVEARGVEVIHGDFHEAQQRLCKSQFDCVFLPNILHIVPQPARLLKSLMCHVAPGGKLVITVPNLMKPRVVWGRLLQDKRYSDLGDYEKTHVHVTSGRRVRKWLAEAGCKIDRMVPVLPGKLTKWSGSLPLGGGILASELITSATKA
jgi:2-polyprenyl-3-methyl-5-hydroxy-6-metoxy-1,4-benzoquinol methylase